jgi:hypothetical protein
MIASFNISLVVHGTTADCNPSNGNIPSGCGSGGAGGAGSGSGGDGGDGGDGSGSGTGTKRATKYDARDDRFKVPKEQGIYREVGSEFSVSVPQIVERVQEHQEKHEERFRRKSQQVQLRCCV